jgi:outer membrane protein assembly factor BamB
MKTAKYLGCLAIALSAALATRHARAEFCWDYMDGNNTLNAFKCKTQDLSGDCGWPSNCTSIPDPSNLISCANASACDQTGCPAYLPNCRYVCDGGQCKMTQLRNHEEWHSCFGDVGDFNGNNPPGRGSRWYAFHRKLEFDFNELRENFVTFGEIESLDWCPNMNLPYGHHGGNRICNSTTNTCQHNGAPCNPNNRDPFTGGYLDCHPRGCGNGPNRPDDLPCPNCVPFPPCLFESQAGPIACANAHYACDPSTNTCINAPQISCNPANNNQECRVCQTPSGGIVFPYDSLEDFPNVEEVTEILDGYFHASMHGAVGTADGGNYVPDVFSSDCSPRDGMFWRLHRALDDVVRSWQNKKATDVMVVLDRSGSMSATDATGRPKYEVALTALDMFADLLEDSRADGQQNRIGVASYSDTANVDMQLTVADANLRAANGPLATAINNIRNNVGGCTSIGSGLNSAIDQLCNGNCENYVPAATENARKAVLLLTDGLENRQPCLNPAQPTQTASCGSTCGGQQFPFNELGEHSQLCALGFGQEGSLNQELLTLVAERQGGIYTQTPDLRADNVWQDLNEFFVKCFGELSDEFVGLDPKGTLERHQFATEPAVYSSCGDDKLTFVGGWNTAVAAKDLRILVNAPNGDLVAADDPSVEASFQDKWSFLRLELPYRTQAGGGWRSQLIRRHRSYVNGFTTDSLPTTTGVSLVRRQIQRLCPDGCDTILYFEDGRLGAASSYDLALTAEEQAGLIAPRVTATDANDFKTKLESASWDLIVYAHQMSLQADEPYDSALVETLCGSGSELLTQRAIVTDTRDGVVTLDLESPEFLINVCAGGIPAGNENWTEVAGDGRLLDGTHGLSNAGYTRVSYGVRKIAAEAFSVEFPVEAQATNNAGGDVTLSGAVSAMGSFGSGLYAKQDWFTDVLVRGLSRLERHVLESHVDTREGLVASVRIRPSSIPAGGYDNVVAAVQVEHPTVGVGSRLIQVGPQPDVVRNGELLNGRAAAFAQAGTIPTATSTFTLNDEGQNGDQHADNGYWTARTDLGRVDGMYRLHFTLDLTKNGCTTRRELERSVFVDVGVDAGSTPVDIVSNPNGQTHTVTVFPKDPFNNPIGWGRDPKVVCGPAPQCTCDPTTVVDHGDGNYSVTVQTQAGFPVRDCIVTIFDEPIPLSGTGTWPMFGRVSSRQRRSPLVGPANESVVWTFDESDADIRTSPAIAADGTIYFGSDDNHVYAVTRDGIRKWRFDTGGDIHSSPAIGLNGTIYVGSDDDHLYALDPDDGSVVCSRSLGGLDVESSPAIGADGTVYVGSEANRLYALDPANCNIKWSVLTGGDVDSSPAIGPDGTIYFGSDDRKVYARHADGSAKWTRTTSGEVDSTPALSNDGTAVYVGSDDDDLWALNAATGAVLWKRDLDGDVNSSPAVGSDGTIYVGSDDGKFYALEPAAGAIRWQRNLGPDVQSSAAIGADGKVYVGSDDRRVYALDGQTGATVWSLRTGGDIKSSPAIGLNQRLYIGSDDNKLYAFGPGQTTLGARSSVLSKRAHDAPVLEPAGCACRASRPDSHPSWSWLVLAATLATRMRRTRRLRRCRP